LKRIKTEELINHPWMLGEEHTQQLPSVPENIKKFKSALKKAHRMVSIFRAMQSVSLAV
jgi:hypothetical protein